MATHTTHTHNRKRQQTYLVEHVLQQPKVNLGQEAVVNRRHLTQNQYLQQGKLRRRLSLNDNGMLCCKHTPPAPMLVAMQALIP